MNCCTVSNEILAFQLSISMNGYDIVIVPRIVVVDDGDEMIHCIVSVADLYYDTGLISAAVRLCPPTKQ